LETALRLVRAASARDPEWLWLYLTGNLAVNRNYPRLAVKSLNAVTNPSPDSSWVPYWTFLATAYHQLNDFQSELKVANHADALHHGQLLNERLRATAASGDTAGLRRLIDSVAMFSTDKPAAPGELMYITATELRAHKYFKDADAMFARARASLAAVPPEAVDWSARFATANVLLGMGRFDSAYARYVELAPDTIHLNARARIGVTAAALHDTGTVRRIDEELKMVATRRLYHKEAPTYWRAAIAAQLGDKELAVRLLNEAIKEGLSVGSEMHRLPEFQSLRGYAQFEEILRPKG
jgi:hypothetical protein